MGQPLADPEPDFSDAEDEVLDTNDVDDMASPASQFEIHPDGIYYLKVWRGKVSRVWVCSPLMILARTRNFIGQDWGYLLEFQDAEGFTHQKAIAAGFMTGGGWCSELMHLGLRLAGNNGRHLLALYLNTAEVDEFALSVDRVGWHGDSFVLLDKVYGDQFGEAIVPQGIMSENPFLQKGSLEEWQKNVGCLCVGNSRLVLAVSAALAAPLLEPLTEESGGIHLVGDTSTGKTTTLCVGGSACGGGPIGFIKQWRVTDNALEGIAAAHCDTLLCLDEMGQAEPRVVSKVAYMLANGQGKGRAKADGQNRKTPTWRSLFLSTGEVSLAEKIAEDGRGHAKAGQGVRVVDIPADAGVGLGLFENLHGCESADRFARKLKEGAGNYYGTPLRAFLQKFVADRDDLTKLASKIVDRLRGCQLPRRS